MASQRTSADFPQGFTWGVAAASYQVEGAAWEDGREACIWDTFARTAGKVAHGHNGDVSVDQYHRYLEDIGLMRDAGIHSYRFSLAWPRIQPTGTGAFNPAGIDYYKRLVDALHAEGISATATVYHWDLPQPLEDAGGWPARDTALRLADYAQHCFRELADHIDRWITLNEPWCSSYLGYFTGDHAPGRRNRSDAWAAGHHLLLGHGLAIQAYRAERGDAETAAPIGTTNLFSTPRPATRREEDVAAADRGADFGTRFFLDPLLGNGYPQRYFDAYPQDTPPPVEPGDMEIISTPVDFLGINFYWENGVTADADAAEGFREVPVHHTTTAMGWPITPRGLYRHLKWIWHHTEGRFPLYITESGAAMDDALSADGLRCHDTDRVDYLRDHFTATLDAIEDGVDVRGYFVWSLIDNFEWAFGYTKRFGVVYADYVNQRRVPKDSYYYLREVISGSEVL